MTSQEGAISFIKEFGPYGYVPSQVGAAIFTSIFGLLFIAHTFLGLKRAPKFMLIVALGALCECTGNGIRIYGHYHPAVVDPYIAQQVLLVVTPVFFAACHFTILGRVLSSFGDKYALVKPKAIVPVFVTVDVISLIIQGTGSGIAAVAEINGEDVTSGGNIVVAGLAIQLAAYAAANVLAVVFFLRTRKSPPQHPGWNHRTKVGLMAAWFSALFILLRSIYRTAELAEGWIGVISTTEWTLLAFDSTFVAIAVLILAVYHPSIYLSASNLDGGEVDEENLKGYQMAEPRSPQNTSVDLPTPKSHTLSLSVSH